MAILGKTFQTLSKNKMANGLARKYGLKFGAKRFVAGKDVNEAVITAKKMNARGIDTIFNYLGEFSEDRSSCIETTHALIDSLKVMSNNLNDCYLTVKLSSIGLSISEEFCKENMRKVLGAAEEVNAFVRMEMEDYTLCDKTLNVYKDLRQEFDNVGTVIQAYLYRTADDLEGLYEYAPNLRLVKGAYNESSRVAYPNKIDVDFRYKELIRTQLLNGHFASIASHDDEAIRYALEVARENDIGKENFEFQMLYGIRPDLEQRLADEGYKVRVYLPYGSEWFGYFMRRLGERPENVSFVLKNTLKIGVS